jgi:chemotaxis protein MotB
MGKAPWETAVADADLQGLGYSPPTGGGRRYGRLLAWVFGIVGLTILLAYYLPLSQAHGQLLEQHKTLAGKAKQLEQSVIEANTAAKAAESRRDELEAQEKQKQDRAGALKQRSEAVREALNAVLQKSAKQGGGALGTSAEGVVVALSDALLFAPRKLDVTPDGRQLLCEIQKASAGRRLAVSAIVDPKASVPQLKAKYPGLWAQGGARVANVAEELESKCGTPRARLRASSLGHAASNLSFDGAKPAPASVLIEIDFSEPG